MCCLNDASSHREGPQGEKRLKKEKEIWGLRQIWGVVRISDKNWPKRFGQKIAKLGRFGISVLSGVLDLFNYQSHWISLADSAEGPASARLLTRWHFNWRISIFSFFFFWLKLNLRFATESASAAARHQFGACHAIAFSYGVHSLPSSKLYQEHTWS